MCYQPGMQNLSTANLKGSIGSSPNLPWKGYGTLTFLMQKDAPWWGVTVYYKLPSHAYNMV